MGLVAITILSALPFYSFAEETPSGAGTITYVKGTAQKKGDKGRGLGEGKREHGSHFR